MSVIDMETTATTPEAKDALKDRPLSDAPESHDKYPRSQLSESLVSVVDVETTVATPEAQDAPEDRPLSDALESHDKYRDVQPQHLSGRHLVHDIDLRLRHLFQKAGTVVERLYMDCDVGVVRMVSILVVVCIALYCLCGAIIYAV